MPVVFFYYNPNLPPTKFPFSKLINSLPAIVASALDVPENPHARLKPEDIEIRVFRNSPEDVNVKQIEILGFAHDYPERAANIDDRVAFIKQEVRKIIDVDSLTKDEGWVWFQLNKTGFARLGV